MTTPTPGDDEFTELVDADIPRVDLVDKAANGLSFLIAKAADGPPGLVNPDIIRGLIAKSEPQTQPAAAGEQVTMTGSPAAIAKLIHGAPVRQTTDPTDAVLKDAELDDSADGMDPLVPLADPGEDVPGDPSSPGSPAWEAIDAATARKWTSLLARAKHAVGILAEREMLEAASADGDESDLDNAIDLDDACCAIDYAISVLAPFAVAEQTEADTGGEMAAVGKALTPFDPASLDTIEALTHVAKAGRTLSTSNEAAIRSAVEQLQKVLASLPAAPETTEDSGQAVAKQEDTVADAAAPQTTTEPPVPDAASVAKADRPPQVAVYDSKGNLVGIADPGDIVPIAAPEPEDGTPADEAATAAAAAPAAAVADLEPAPAADAGTAADAAPADDAVAKTTDITDPTADTTSDAVLKSIAKDAATAAVDAYSATQEQVIAKQAADLAQMAKDVEELKSLVKALEEQPAIPRVFTNGAVPSTQQLRGQDSAVAPIDVAKAREMKRSLYGAADASDQKRIADEMNTDAITRLQEIHQRH